MDSRAMLDQRLWGYPDSQMWRTSKPGDTTLTKATKLPWDLVIHSVPSQKGKWSGFVVISSLWTTLHAPIAFDFPRCMLRVSCLLAARCHWCMADRVMKPASLLQISVLYLFNCHFRICRSLFNASCLKYSPPLTHSMPRLGIPKPLSSRQMTNQCNPHSATLYGTRQFLMPFSVQACTSVMRVSPLLPTGRAVCSCPSLRANGSSSCLWTLVCTSMTNISNLQVVQAPLSPPHTPCLLPYSNPAVSELCSPLTGNHSRSFKSELRLPLHNTQKHATALKSAW